MNLQFKANFCEISGTGTKIVGNKKRSLTEGEERKNEMNAEKTRHGEERNATPDGTDTSRILVTDGNPNGEIEMERAFSKSRGTVLLLRKNQITKKNQQTQNKT